MTTIAGLASSYQLPQYIGELFQKAQRPNAFLRLIGGLTGSLRVVRSTEFPMGVNYQLAAAAQPAITEGQAPSYVEQDTAQESNLVQIFQYGAQISYSKLATTAHIDGVAVIPGAGEGEINLPGTFEFQIARKMEQLARDVNYSFLNGAYQKPTDNTTARKTRGVLSAISTNVFANGGVGRNLTQPIFEGALRDSMDNGMFLQGAEVFAIAGKTELDNLQAIYRASSAGPTIFRDAAGQVGGVDVRTIQTAWATVHLVWDPDMPAGEILLTRPEVCAVTAMEIPDKGLIFAEPLAQTGAAENWQVYGELGLDYRSEIFHALVKDLN